MAPFVSGKDSLNNVFAWTDAAGRQQELSIPPTLLATAVGQVDDVRRAVSPDLKGAGNRLAIVGTTRHDIAGTQLELTGRVHGGGLPTVEPAACRAAWAALAATRAAGLLASCHDCSDGGLAAAVAEMAIGGDCGARIDLGRVPLAGDGPMPDLAIAFAETPGRFICEVRPEHAAAFAAQLDRMTGVAWGWIGTVAAEPVVEIMASDGGLAAVPVDRLAAAWRREDR